MAFTKRYTYPMPSFMPFMLDRVPYLHRLGHFDMMAEHTIYNRVEFQQVMPRDTVYISSLREPVAQFKSGINYFKVLVVKFMACLILSPTVVNFNIRALLQSKYVQTFPHHHTKYATKSSLNLIKYTMYKLTQSTVHEWYCLFKNVKVHFAIDSTLTDTTTFISGCSILEHHI